MKLFLSRLLLGLAGLLIPLPALTQEVQKFSPDMLQSDAVVPRYPPTSITNHEEGKVVLRVFVNTEGQPEKVEIKSSSGYQRLDEAATQAVTRWQFRPATLKDKPVAAWVDVPIVFTVENQ